MKTLDSGKKSWSKPSVKTLIIRKDTFGGSATGTESQIPKGAASVPKDPTPR